jgi:hypothetical protein
MPQNDSRCPVYGMANFSPAQESAARLSILEPGRRDKYSGRNSEFDFSLRSVENFSDPRHEFAGQCATYKK